MGGQPQPAGDHAGRADAALNSAPSDPTTAELIAALTGPPHRLSDPSRPAVILVDGDEDGRVRLIDALQRFGCDLLVALHSVFPAPFAIRQRHPTVVVVALDVDRGDAWSTLQLLRDLRQEWPTLPLLTIAPGTSEMLTLTTRTLKAGGTLLLDRDDLVGVVAAVRAEHDRYIQQIRGSSPR